MEVFVRNLPQQTSEKGLRKFLEPYLKALSISTFSCQKTLRSKIATVTFVHEKQGQLFLEKHGQYELRPNQRHDYPNARHLILMGAHLFFCKSNKPADKFQLRILQTEEKAEHVKAKSTLKIDDRSRESNESPRMFASSSVSCGVWSYDGSELVFTSHLTWSTPGEVKFGIRTLVLTIDSQRIDFTYSWIKDITIGGHSNPSMTITCLIVPKFSEKADSLDAFLRELGFQQKNQGPQKNKAQWNRLSSLGDEHQKIVSACLVYRVYIISPNFNEQIRSFKKIREMTSVIYRRTHLHLPKEPFKEEMRRLQAKFASSYQALPFPIMFQLQKLAQNGYLSPKRVLELFPELILMAKRSGTAITVSAIRKLFHQVPYAGPEAEAEHFHLKTLIRMLKENEDKAKKEDTYSKVLGRGSESDNMANIYRAKVTPSHVYLQGPEPEVKNRVLRKYSNHLDFFLRVQFCDEDGQQLRYDPRVSNETIFHDRFKMVLQDSITIAGRQYGFLGFSHSSLRSQTCWFMASFVDNGELQLYQRIIGKLGDFSSIRSPAKCAARIGQAFSDTPNTVPLENVQVVERPDVERNGRVFSDGVGVISQSVLEQIWESLPKKRLVKPTLFQIRYSGAKGMISLDSRIRGHSMILRPSMIKFGSDATDIELCGAAYQPLPMFLNKQIIKIMEDLGVPDQYFLKLQANAIERLRKATSDTTNASNFLAAHSIGELARLPWLMKKLLSLNLSFHEDAFLRDVVELSVLVELRALKHRARLLVKEGATLYGIMDETGILLEGQVFVILDTKPGMSKVISGNILVTRSPALHPGDIQLVTAVDVPKNSPLMKLSNCICFSQKGSRDLPSQLSGGDLDGDLFNVVWDKDCWPGRTYQAADYPRQEAIDIGRAITRKDMTEFFVKFMETDQLGRIATQHQVVADQKSKGTLDEDALTLAAMHSTAVDFSKTGIPVDMSKMPKSSRCRPDFMAPGPHVVVIKKEMVKFVDDGAPGENVDDDDEMPPHRYYESDNVLGKLYRNIDERQFFKEAQQNEAGQGIHGSRGRADYSNTYVLDIVWKFVQRRCKSLNWSHHLDWARDIKDMYDECILVIMGEYSDHPSRPLSELEVFVGNILGKTGQQSRQQRELSVTMKNRFDEDLGFIINNIVKDGVDPSMEALERSVACFEISCESSRNIGLSKEVVSFRYVAAAVCLREIERCSGGRLHEGFT